MLILFVVFVLIFYMSDSNCEVDPEPKRFKADSDCDRLNVVLGDDICLTAEDDSPYLTHSELIDFVKQYEIPKDVVVSVSDSPSGDPSIVTESISTSPDPTVTPSAVPSIDDTPPELAMKLPAETLPEDSSLLLSGYVGRPKPMNDLLNYRIPTIAWIGDNKVDEPVRGSYKLPSSLPVPDDPPPDDPPPDDPPPDDPPLQNNFQYTPAYRNGGVGGAQALYDMTVLSQNVSSVDSQDPDGIMWLGGSAGWTNAVWDGVPKNPCTMTKAQLCAYAFPSSNTMRGLREKFYEINPFSDVTNPTAAEIDRWNVEVIRHFRSLFGITTPIEADRCLYLRAQWATERKHSTYWDAAYPGTFNSAYGPCVGGSNAHCGSTFIPSEADQAPYLDGLPVCGSTAGAEGVFGTNANIPWSIKLARIMASVICTEGMTGHAGPFFGRTKMGLAWHVAGAGVTLRAKWGGDLVSPC
jgi:hypothetical protein